MYKIIYNIKKKCSRCNKPYYNGGRVIYIADEVGKGLLEFKVCKKCMCDFILKGDKNNE